MVKRIKILMMFFLLLFLIGCKNEEVLPTWGLNINQSEYNLVVGDKIELEIEVHEYFEKETITFSSTNADVATVQDMILEAKTEGDTVIRISFEEYPDYAIEINVIVEHDNHNLKTHGVIMEWVKKQIGKTLLMPKIFPRHHPHYDAEIIYESSNPEILSNIGITFPELFNTTVTIQITVLYEEDKLIDNHEVMVVGSAFADIANKFFDQFPVHRKIMRDYKLKAQEFAPEGAVVKWTSSDEKVFTNNGVYYKPFDDMTIYIELEISYPELEEKYTVIEEFMVVGVTIHDKAAIVKKWIEQKGIITEILDNDIELPNFYGEEFDAILEWNSNKPNIVSTTGIIKPTSVNELINLYCEVIIGDASSTIIFKTEVPAKRYQDKWEEIEAFLNEIAIKEVQTQRYTVNGVAQSYRAYNYGYVPFFVSNKSQVIEAFLPTSRHNRPSPNTHYERKFVVIHDTANNNPNAGAKMHHNFINTTTKDVSWHYSVDDIEIYHHIPDKEIAWHAGEQSGNRYGIGIETCINPEVDYTVVMRKTAKLTAELLYKYNLTLKDIRQHYDFTQKDCPHVMRSNNRWNEFLKLTAIEYAGTSRFSNVDFKWESLSKDIMDDTGRIHNHPGIEKNVNYKVVVTYQNEVKEFYFSSKLLPTNW